MQESSVAGRFALLEAWLLARVEGGRPTHPATAWAVRELASSPGGTRVEQLAAASGFSRKYLSALFRREVGLTPRKLARLYRFHGVLAEARRAPSVSWAELAAAHGYYDQSHLIRDVNAFCGFSPERLLATQSVDPFTLVVE